MNRDQFRAVANAIADTFDQNELSSLLKLECGRRLDELVGLPMEWRPLVTRVVERAEQQEFANELVMAVASWRPRNAILSRVLREFTQAPGSAATLSVSPDLNAGFADGVSALQGLVRSRAVFADFDAFLSDLAKIGPRVCCIEADGEMGAAVGTGFLVGDDLVLTNYHVQKILASRNASPVCRFDYLRLGTKTGVREGMLVPCADSSPWVASRSYAPSDLHDGATPPTAEQLDYALLRLAEPVGRFPPGRTDEGAKKDERGHFVLRSDALPLQAGEEVIVVQHPGGAPLKIAMGSALATVIPRRCSHDAPTQSGTSGSPVFDLQLRLRALHHATDPADPNRPRFNQAIPIALIAADLAAMGVKAC